MINWTTVLVALIGSLPLTITAITGLVVVVRKLDKQHALMNSRMDEQIKSVEKAATAIGELKGAEDERDRAASATRAPRERKK